MAPKLGGRKIIIESTDSPQKDANAPPAGRAAVGAALDTSPLKGRSKASRSQKLPTGKEPTARDSTPHQRSKASSSQKLTGVKEPTARDSSASHKRSKDESSQRLPPAKGPTTGKPIPHKRILSSQPEPAFSKYAHLPKHQRDIAEKWEDEQWEPTRDWFAEFFQVYRDGNADATVFDNLSPWVPDGMVNIGNWFKWMFIKYGAMPLMRPIRKYSDSRDRSEWEHAQELVGNAVKLMTSSPSYSKLRFNRVLTWGGMGLVALFDVAIPNNPNYPKQVVVKCELKERGIPFYSERKCHEYLRRAKHIVQLVNLKLGLSPKANQAGPSTPPSARKRRSGDDSDPGTSPRKRQRKQEVSRGGQGDAPVFKKPLSVQAPQDVPLPSIEDDPSAEKSLLMIEFMRRGDLNQYLTKQSERMNRIFLHLEAQTKIRGAPFSDNFIHQQMQVSKFPDKVLWLIFQCLFKGVIGIVAPPKVRPGYEETGGDDGPMVDEEPPDPRYPIKREDTTHFDLDPKNVLVGDAENLYVPVHKISDLGLMEPMVHKKKDRRHYNHIWSTRIIGKPRGYWLAPEQFTEEWDMVTRLPMDAPPPRIRIAGNYSWKTNLYNIGTIMWCLITRFEPPVPAYGENYGSYGGDFEDINPVKHSYGGFLNKGSFEDVDPDLRNLVIECMSDDPADRPRMEKMYKIIEKKVESILSKTDKDLQAWCAGFYHGSLEAPPHTSAQLQDWVDHSYDFAILFPDKSFGLERPLAPKPLVIPKAKAAAPAPTPAPARAPAARPPVGTPIGQRPTRPELGLKDLRFPKPPAHFFRPKGPVQALQGTPGFATPGAASPATPAGFQGPATPAEFSPMVPGVGAGKPPVLQFDFDRSGENPIHSRSFGERRSGPLFGREHKVPPAFQDQSMEYEYDEEEEDEYDPDAMDIESYV
ncbi:hypothetical protein QBC34DRAFT_416572 [Podospora aff. communis PSN243]|uniref:Protein kinase domain-containing protein n=1 Tax=Podospora aff. communis PSN243 TaxID=3040156 RepID=A0AAV9G6H7_9PEZI|nr:hypothetical protein QBC34DRAFT_416572 [Podospora aff. communis PSN243]